MNSKNLTVFPEYNTSVSKGLIHIETFVRILGTDNMFYLTKVVQNLAYTDNESFKIQMAINRFTFDCYGQLILATVDLSVVSLSGASIYHYDENQETENERLRRLYNGI